MALTDLLNVPFYKIILQRVNLSLQSMFKLLHTLIKYTKFTTKK